MNLTKTAFGVWSGGRFMHYGRKLDREEFIQSVRSAYDKGIRTFVTADVYGEGEGDELLKEGLAPYPRDSYCLVGAIGHDIYKGKRAGPKGFPRFTDPQLRGADGYKEYLEMALEKSLARCGTDHFDLLLLHNPDRRGYTSEVVWETMAGFKAQGKAERIGIAPGPANGFVLDLIRNFETFGEHIDWAMVILNPFEPWPQGLVLETAEKHGIEVLTRVVDFGGLFFDDVKPGHRFAAMDHRTYRPAGWVEAGNEKLEKLRPYAERHDLTPFHLACQWNLAQPAVSSVVPSIIQEVGDSARSFDSKLEELANLPDEIRLTAEEIEEIRAIGDNSNCMALKGAGTQFQGPEGADQWPLDEELWEISKRHDIHPDRELYYPADPRDLREKGMARGGMPQTMDRRLYVRLLVYRGANPAQIEAAKELLAKSNLHATLYADTVDPSAVGVLVLSEDPDVLVEEGRDVLNQEPFASLTLDPAMTMFGRTYGFGREPSLEEFLIERPLKRAADPSIPWAVWYPLRRKGEFYRLPKKDQMAMLKEHGMIGYRYGQSGYAADIRLESFAMDREDNEFIIGLLGSRLDWLSKLVKDMRPTKQTAEYLDSIGPFFVGKAIYQKPYEG